MKNSIFDPKNYLYGLLLSKEVIFSRKKWKMVRFRTHENTKRAEIPRRSQDFNSEPNCMGNYISEYVWNRGLESFMPITLIFLTVLCRKGKNAKITIFGYKKWSKFDVNSFFRIRIIKLCVLIFAKIPSKWPEAFFGLPPTTQIFWKMC